MASVQLTEDQKRIGTYIILVLLIGGGIFAWSYDRDYSKLYSENKLIAKESFDVYMNRDWSTIKYSYQRDSCLEVGGNIKEYENSKPRCYYPQNYYIKLNRNLKKTGVSQTEQSDFYLVNRDTAYFQYGTSGDLAGNLNQEYKHLKDVNDVKQFPVQYLTTFTPEDKKKYKLVWNVENLKEINVPNGKYTSCEYKFGKILINLGKECDKLEYAEVINEDDGIYFHFKEAIGKQELELKLVDPPLLEITDAFPHITINESLVMVESQTGAKLNITDSSTEVGVKQLASNKYEWYYIYTYQGPGKNPQIHMDCNVNDYYSNMTYTCGDISVDMSTPTSIANISSFPSTRVLEVLDQPDMIKFQEPLYNPGQNTFTYLIVPAFNDFSIGDKIVLDPIITIAENIFIDNSTYVNMRSEGSRFSHISIGGNI